VVWYVRELAGDRGGGGGGGGGVWVVSRTQPVGMAGKAQASIHALAPVQQPANPRRRRCSRARVVSAAHSFVAYTRRVHDARRRRRETPFQPRAFSHTPRLCRPAISAQSIPTRMRQAAVSGTACS